MDEKLFNNFCSNMRLTKAVKRSFREWLRQKYNNNIPNDVNFSSEWKLFVLEATSKL